MTLLLSNYPPVEFSNPSFNEIFGDLIENAKQLDIATGYVSEKSLNHLANLIHKKRHLCCNLIIGMHYFDKFTHSQYAAAREMEQFLQDNNLGSVKLVTSFRYHGKIYSFKNSNGSIKSIVGSSNLNNILPHNTIKQYELDILIDDQHLNSELADFIGKLSNISPDLSSKDLIIDSFKKNDNFMTELPNVELVKSRQIAEFKNSMHLDKMIQIPIKTYEEAPHSNINIFFGQGRKNKSTGVISKRPWYEAEIVVSKKITSLDWYPKPIYPETENIINVFTDDGYQFKCRIGGANNKNFRSAGDLKILGKWLKGRLENAGLLKVGEKVTKDILEKYGRNYIDLIPTNDPKQWYLDFSQKN